MSVFKKLAAAQAAIKCRKLRHNSFGKYYYRNCEDIFESLKPLIAKMGFAVVLRDTIEEVGEHIYVRASATFVDTEAEGDSAVTVYAYAREVDSKKGMDPAQITGAASSYARKYALNGLFLLDDAKDADACQPAYDGKLTQGSQAGRKPGELTAPELLNYGKKYSENIMHEELCDVRTEYDKKRGA